VAAENLRYQRRAFFEFSTIFEHLFADDQIGIVDSQYSVANGFTERIFAEPPSPLTTAKAA